MSLESALDEERREVVKLLEAGRGTRPSRGSFSMGSTGPFELRGRTDSPSSGARSAVKSMLDVDDDPPGPVTNLPPQGPPVRAPAQIQTVRSLLDPPESPRVTVRSANSSPIDAARGHRQSHRSSSDASLHPPPSTGARLLRDRDRPTPMTTTMTTTPTPTLPSPNADYSFAMAPSNQAIALPKRAGQGGRMSGVFPNTMARVMQAMELGDPGSALRGNERGRMAMEGRGPAGHSGSRSPSSRFGRSQSPHTRKLNTNSMNLMPGPGKFVSEGGQVVDMNNAYRRLSDAHLARSGGSLSNLAVRSASDPSRLDHEAGGTSPSRADRLHEDEPPDDAAEEQALAESSDDGSGGSSGAEWGTEDRRGRIRDRTRGTGVGGGGGAGGAEGSMEHMDWGGPGRGPGSMGRAQGPRQTLSLLAAAEEEREQVSSKYKVRSLLGPPVTVTGPGGERLNPKKVGVHPTTSFDQGTSTPVTSDTEAEMSELRRAQRMNIRISGITSTPDAHRSIRTILRGEFDKMQEEIDEGLRRQRTYLVATDLSDEAAYALEWTIGTILRDGDTLLAVYAMDEESGAGRSGGGDGDSVHGIGVGEGTLAVKDQAALVGSLTSKAPPHGMVTTTTTTTTTTAGNLSPLSVTGFAGSSTSTSVSPDSRHGSRVEQERVRATEDITQRCVKLLRKTRLQVRVVIEVIHCKSPKHLITEVIDFIDPTLVILGSRGRSALKGVLLGSFSNYLVTKSSVPVMVARKRLRKHSKFKKTNVRQPNNLMSATGGAGGVKSLATAKID